MIFSHNKRRSKTAKIDVFDTKEIVPGGNSLPTDYSIFFYSLRNASIGFKLAAL
jgi:hypothetical protein